MILAMTFVLLAQETPSDALRAFADAVRKEDGAWRIFDIDVEPK